MEIEVKNDDAMSKRSKQILITNNHIIVVENSVQHVS